MNISVLFNYVSVVIFNKLKLAFLYSPFIIHFVLYTYCSRFSQWSFSIFLFMFLVYLCLFYSHFRFRPHISFGLYNCLLQFYTRYLLRFILQRYVFWLLKFGICLQLHEIIIDPCFSALKLPNVCKLIRNKLLEFSIIWALLKIKP